MSRRELHGREYIHGHSEREAERLHDQARTLEELLHHGTRYPAGHHVLEAGCGVGAQTVILARNSPGAVFTSVDLSGESLCQAQARVEQECCPNVRHMQGVYTTCRSGPGPLTTSLCASFSSISPTPSSHYLS